MKITTILAALACAAAASTAQAGVVLDQANMPETGPVPVFGDQATGFNPEQGTHGQSFTAGVDGRLARIDLAVLDFTYAEPAGGLTFSLEDAWGTELFSTHVDYADLPEFEFFVVDFSQMLQIDLSAANVSVSAGQIYKMFLAPDAGSGLPGPGWFYIFDNKPLTYSDGDGIYRSGVYPDITNTRLDYGFRTYVAVPEPGAWALMILGFGAVGATARRRRFQAA